jgi:hypothetical protein
MIRWLMFAAALVIAAIEVASFVYLHAASKDFIVARRERRLPIYALGTVVSWQGGSFGQLYGWSRPDPLGSWSIGPTSAFAMRIRDRAPGDLELRVFAEGVIDAARMPSREVAVSINGMKLAHWRFDVPRQVLQTVRIPTASIREDGSVRVEFTTDDYRSPQELGMSTDTRAIGIRVVEWQISPLAGGGDKAEAANGVERAVAAPSSTQGPHREQNVP